MILIFDSVAYWIFPVESHLHKTKCQIDTFHEVLPGNLVFFHFYYCGTTVIEYLDQTTALYRKNYISTENFTFGTQHLSETSCDQIVYQNEEFSAEFFLSSLQVGKLMVQAIRKHENKKQNINTYFAFSVRPVLTNSSLLIFSTQPLTNYFTLQRYIALVFLIF